MSKNPSFNTARQALILLAVFAFRVAAAGAPVAVQLPAAAASETIRYGRFGAVDVYRRAGGESRNVVLFLSGEGGWNDAAAGMASRLADTGAIVAAIDTSHYLRQLDAAPAACISPAVDLENLSHYLQSKLALRSYLQPTLIGYAAGAALAFATLAEAPDGLFKGGLSIDYRPDLALKKPLCNKSAQRRSFSATTAPTRTLVGHWLSLQTDPGRVVENGVQLDAAFRRVTAPQPAAERSPALPVPVADLPLVLVPAQGREADWFGIFLTGDGGWVGLD
ncbi:MAG: hypothetical protein M3O06_00310, partial [Pseudomonadota bacterium]|nr:hypothetical protein [Pseudomonadota bacterium]